MLSTRYLMHFFLIKKMKRKYSYGQNKEESNVSRIMNETKTKESQSPVIWDEEMTKMTMIRMTKTKAIPVIASTGKTAAIPVTRTKTISKAIFYLSTLYVFTFVMHINHDNISYWKYTHIYELNKA